MKHLILSAILLVILTPFSYAQGGAEGYDMMSVRAGKMVGNFNTGQMDSLTGGANIVLKASDSSQPDMPIKATSITFTWKAGQTMPAVIKMEGNVDIRHPDAKITAQRADWNLESGDLVFTGSPVMDSPALKGLRASKISINLTTGAYEIEQGEADGVPLQGMGGDGGGGSVPGELSDGDVTDWTGLIDTLKSQGKADGENPGKQILQQLDDKTRGLLETIDTAALVSNKGDLLKKINGVVRRPGMFKRSAWEGITLTDETEALIAKKDQTPAEQVRQNRLVLNAAYPNLIAAP